MKIELYKPVALTEDLPEHGLKKGDTAIAIEHYPMPEGEEDGYSLEGFGVEIEGVTVEVRESQIEPIDVEAGDDRAEICDRCQQSFVVLPIPCTKRKCQECGKMIYVCEPGEDGQGMMVRAGDRVVIPAGFLRLSLDPEQASAQFTREGISAFAKMLFFQYQRENFEEIELMFQDYENYAWKVIDQSSIWQNLDPAKEEDVIKFRDRVQQDKKEELWAGEILKSAFDVKEILGEGASKKLAHEMSKLINFHAMLVFKQGMEETVWRGYVANQLTYLLNSLEKNEDNASEEFWQKLFIKTPLVLSQTFSFPAILFNFDKDKAYVGGKGVDNRGGNVVDFLLKNQLSDNTALIEIKTPQTKLLGSEYRQGVYKIAGDLSGAIVQVMNYRHSLMKNYTTLFSEEVSRGGEGFYTFNPQCVVIVGNLKNEIDNIGKKQSFELFRSSLKDVQIVTYDELFQKVKLLTDLLESKVVPM